MMLFGRLVTCLLVALCASGTSALAQDATPRSGFDPVSRFPAHILADGCGESAEVVTTLDEGGYGLPVAATPQAGAALHVGDDDANPAIVSVTRLDTSLDELAGGNHAIDVHSASATGPEDATRLVCGVIGGFRAGGDLVFGLEEENDSRYGGTAWLRANDDGSTTVTLFLASGLARHTVAGDVPSAIEEAEPLGGLPPAVEVAGIIIEEAAFSAERLTLHEGIPTVVHVVNGDDVPYRLRIEGLLTETELPPQQLTVLEFTTPTWGTFEAQLLDAEGEEILDTYPVEVDPVEG